uniref:Uncharacterized protein n=1 Tax=Arion vulgaris TaxID=1028688 RepID=A0A0B6Z5V4_9EUPU
MPPVTPAPVKTIRHLFVVSSQSFTKESLPQDNTYLEFRVNITEQTSLPS